MGEKLTKKKRIRAGHRASVTRIIAQVQQALESEELNSSKLKQQLQTLREKVDVLRKLHSDILSALETEDITGDIEQADIVKETLESTILDLDAALTTQEQNNSPTVQPTLGNPAPEQPLSSSRKTAKAQVFRQDTPSSTVNTRIIFDSGSQRSYIVSRIRDLLALPTEMTERVLIKTFGSKVEKVQVCDVVNLAIKTKNGMSLYPWFVSLLVGNHSTWLQSISLIWQD
ncbi:hypothetical protein EMCRGX_G026896 [Ephydatia muelleri]